MEIEEYRLAVTYLFQLAKSNGLDQIATLWKKSGLLHVQKTPPVAEPTSIALPVVELLRSSSQGNRLQRGLTVATTYAPTAACLGMARMCGVEKIVYLKDHNIMAVTTPHPTAPVVTQLRDLTTNTFPEVTLPKQQGVKWYKSVAPKDALLSWAKSCERHPLIGADLNSALNMPWGAAAVPTKFPDSPLEYLGMRQVAGMDEEVMDNVLMMMAWELIARGSGFKSDLKGQTLPEKTNRLASTEGQRIGSILADEEASIVGWGFNTNKQNSTRHGETNLIEQYMQTEKKLPAGGTLYTTLEPCEMCSGMIVRAVAHGDKFRVIYGQPDANVHFTALQAPPSGSKITMSATAAAMVDRQKSAPVVHVGKPVGFAESIAANQRELREKATTAYLKREDTYRQYMAAGRPAWWMYLWDTTVAQLQKRKGEGELKLDDPDVQRANAQLANIYDLSERFMAMVQQAALGE